VAVALGPRATLRRRFARCVAVCAGVAFAVLACELAARWFANASPSRNPFYSLEDPGNLAAPDLPFVRPPHLDWTGPSTGDLSDGLRDQFTQTVRFRTDFQGFRNDADAARAAIVFLGDSNTEAGNVNVEQTFVDRAAHSLGRTYRNLGRAGYSPPDELVVLERYGLECEPKLVVWQISEQNDLYDCLRYIEWARSGVRPVFDPHFASAPLELDGWKRYSPTHQLYDRLSRHARAPFEVVLTARDGSRLRTRFVRSMFGRELDPQGHPGWPPIEKGLRDGAKLIAEHGCKLAILFIPMKLRVLEAELGPHAAIRGEAAARGGIPRPSPLSLRLAALARELGAIYIDPTDALERCAAAGDVVFLPLDTHPSPFGHEQIAQIIVATLRDAGFK
jgi:hypothetical protein